MHKIVIFGNSGSGKTTLANHYVEEYHLPHLDLDLVAWENTDPPGRKPLPDSAGIINQFTETNNTWVIEGCYADLLSLVVNQSTALIFLNPGIDVCLENCKSRPWEPRKYSSIEDQNNKLDMLLNWVKQYEHRDDEFSLTAHRALYDSFTGYKKQYNSRVSGLSIGN